MRRLWYLAAAVLSLMAGVSLLFAVILVAGGYWLNAAVAVGGVAGYSYNTRQALARAARRRRP